MKNDVSRSIAAWLPASQQRIFRQLMHAFAYPGRVATIAEKDGDAARFVLATLVDAGVSLADPHNLVDPLDRLRLETTNRAADAADFIIADGRMHPDFKPRLGTLESPDQSATIIVLVEKIGSGTALQLSGPGIPATEIVSVAGLAPEWIVARAEWVGEFPAGADLLLVDGLRVVALPRTTRIVLKGAA